MRERKIVELTPEMLEPYRECLIGEERSWATTGRHLGDTRKSLEHLEDGGKIDKERVWEFKQGLMGHYKTSSVSFMLAVVNSLLGSVGRGDLEVKLLKVQRVIYGRPEREMTEKEYGGLVQTVKRLGDLRMNMLLQTIDSTGIRISELRFITVESLETGWVEVYNKEKSRVVLPPVELTRLSEEYRRKAGIYAGSIFTIWQRSLLDRSSVSEKMKRLGKGARMDTAKVFPYSLCHLFTGVFHSIEKDMVRLMNLLGHSSISTTRIYAVATEGQPKRQMSWVKLALG